jgi:hypothetical protein
MFATIAMMCASSEAVADPIGLWLARDGAHVDIAPCGNELCGVLVSTASPIDPATALVIIVTTSLNPGHVLAPPQKMDSTQPSTRMVRASSSLRLPGIGFTVVPVVKAS